MFASSIDDHCVVFVLRTTHPRDRNILHNAMHIQQIAERELRKNSLIAHFT